MCQNNRTMKLHHILYTLLLISLFPITSNGQPARKEKLRVISYNIWNGFEHDASRRANFIDWIKGQQPDILAITELVGFTEKNLGQLASEYGHKYYAIVKEEGYPIYAVCMSLPINERHSRPLSFTDGNMATPVCTG